MVSTVPGVQSCGLDPLFASCLEHDPPRPDVSPAGVHSLRKKLNNKNFNDRQLTMAIKGGTEVAYVDFWSGPATIDILLPLTNDFESGSGRPKSLRILRIRNTGRKIGKDVVVVEFCLFLKSAYF